MTDLSHHASMIQMLIGEMANAVSLSAEQLRRPSFILKPKLTLKVNLDGKQTWSAKYGPIDAFGSTPKEAMESFDRVWEKGI